MRNRSRTRWIPSARKEAGAGGSSSAFLVCALGSDRDQDADSVTVCTATEGNCDPIFVQTMNIDDAGLCRVLAGAKLGRGESRETSLEA